MNTTKKYRQNAYAVIIGIDKYKDPKVANLSFARADAEGIFDVLTDSALGQFSPDKVFLLLDEKATQRNIRTVIGNDLRRMTNENDLVYIYYAGHGSAEIDPRSKNQDGIEKYLIPHDAELDNLFATGIAMDEVQKFFYRLESKQVIFFVDSCYSGEAGGRTFQNPNYQKRAALTSDFLDDLSGEGRLVVTACDVNEVSLETPQKKHGLFTYHLIEGLKGLADIDGDGLVTMHELYDYVYKHVSQDSKILGGSMHPVQKGSVKGEIFLTQYETESQKVAKSLNSQAISALKSGQIDRALDLWQRALELVPEFKSAKQGIEYIKKRREEERQREDAISERKRKNKQLLFDLAGKGVLPDRILKKALDILTSDPKQLTGYSHTYNTLLNKLGQKQIEVGEFIEEWYKVETERPAEKKVEEIRKPKQVEAGKKPEEVYEEIRKPKQIEAAEKPEKIYKEIKSSNFIRILTGAGARCLFAIPLGIRGLLYTFGFDYPDIYLSEGINSIFGVTTGLCFTAVSISFIIKKGAKQAAILLVIILALIILIQLISVIFTIVD